MFKELAPLLRHRSVLFTVSHLGDDQFRVNIVPKRIGDSENEALTIPVSVSGTAEDLDAQLAGTMVNFVFEPSGTQKHARAGEGRHGRGREVRAGRGTRQIKEPDREERYKRHASR
jgi:PRTRC genetic system protein E